MPEKRSTYGDITVTDTESDSPNKQDEPAEKNEPQTNTTITVTETQPTEEENTQEVNTLPPLAAVRTRLNRKANYKHRYAQPSAPK